MVAGPKCHCWNSEKGSDSGYILRAECFPNGRDAWCDREKAKMAGKLELPPTEKGKAVDGIVGEE